jgi:hypothetical protein
MTHFYVALSRHLNSTKCFEQRIHIPCSVKVSEGREQQIQFKNDHSVFWLRPCPGQASRQLRWSLSLARGKGRIPDIYSLATLSLKLSILDFI